MTTISTPYRRPKVLHITLWILQAILASMFMMGGFMKTFMPIAELSATMPWASDIPQLTRFIGITQILGALGLILPAALKIAPRLTVWAASGLALTMVLALLFHINRGEMSALPINIVLGLLAGFIAWGRSTKAPIYQREK
jgi:putative oxidoreductase